VNFSVCICVYANDVAEYFKEALASIVSQTLTPNEIVLVVDGPIPQSLQGVIEQYKETTQSLNIDFKTIYLSTNQGHGEARKIGIQNCSYELIALADADDVNLPERFEKQIAEFNSRNDVSIIGGQIIEIDHQTKVPLSRKEVPQSNEEIREFIKQRCPFNQMTVMFKKSNVLAAGNYIDFYHNEDYYLWVRMFLKGYTFFNLPDTLVLARVNQNFYNRRGGVRYFVSEYKLQKIMFSHHMIGFPRFCFNIIVRFIIQVVLPDGIRGFIFKKLFRKEVENV